MWCKSRNKRDERREIDPEPGTTSRWLSDSVDRLKVRTYLQDIAHLEAEKRCAMGNEKWKKWQKVEPHAGQPNRTPVKPYTL
jgi:hypothetical protein